MWTLNVKSKITMASWFSYEKKYSFVIKKTNKTQCPTDGQLDWDLASCKHRGVNPFFFLFFYIKLWFKVSSLWLATIPTDSVCSPAELSSRVFNLLTPYGSSILKNALAEPRNNSLKVNSTILFFTDWQLSTKSTDISMPHSHLKDILCSDNALFCSSYRVQWAFSYLCPHVFWFEWICEVFSSRGNGFCQCILAAATYYPPHISPSIAKASLVNKNTPVNFLKCPSNSFNHNKSIYITSLHTDQDWAYNFMYKLRVCLGVGVGIHNLL